MNGLFGRLSDKVEIISPRDDYHYFFGYYDLRATGICEYENRHLAHRVKFIDRIPKDFEECEIGYIENGEFHLVDTTRAWNFQQGAMLTYHPTRKGVILYNKEISGKFVTVIRNLETGAVEYVDRPFATLSPDGRTALSVNFGRIFTFRTGYGYAGYRDGFAAENAPSEDGVFLLDLDTKSSRLLVSYRDLLSESGFCEDDKILVNHITLSPSSDKFLMLIRNIRTDGGLWKTSMLVSDLCGNLNCVLKKTYISHYFWESNDRIIAHTTPEGKERGLYYVDARDGTTEWIDSFFFQRFESDIHCSLASNGRYVIGDGYPVEGYRPLLCIDRQTGDSELVLHAKSIAPSDHNVRCDLHARECFGGRYVSFDTTHNDRREIARFPVDALAGPRG